VRQIGGQVWQWWCCSVVRKGEEGWGVGARACAQPAARHVKVRKVVKLQVCVWAVRVVRYVVNAQCV